MSTPTSITPATPNLKAFTLIELLTVIAIIGILAAIIIPTVSSVRESARNATCKNRIRQWAMAFTLYANDNRGNYMVFNPARQQPWCQVGGTAAEPPPYTKYMNAGATAGTSQDFGDFAYCPSFDNFAVKGLNSPQRTCYVATVPHVNGVTVNPAQISLNRATAPAKTIMLLERAHVASTGLLADMAAPGGSNDLSLRLENANSVRSQYPSFLRHGRKANAAFMDAHVKSMAWNDGSPGTSLMRDPGSGINGQFDPNWLRMDR